MTPWPLANVHLAQEDVSPSSPAVGDVLDVLLDVRLDVVLLVVTAAHMFVPTIHRSFYRLPLPNASSSAIARTHAAVLPPLGCRCQRWSSSEGRAPAALERDRSRSRDQRHGRMPGKEPENCQHPSFRGFPPPSSREVGGRPRMGRRHRTSSGERRGRVLARSEASSTPLDVGEGKPYPLASRSWEGLKSSSARGRVRVRVSTRNRFPQSGRVAPYGADLDARSRRLCEVVIALGTTVQGGSVDASVDARDVLGAVTESKKVRDVIIQ